MSISAIESVLQQMRAAAAGSGIGAPAASAPGADFAAELKRSLDQVSTAQDTAYARADAFEAGAAGVSLNDVMLGIQKANVGFQFAVQVRNRLVSAYDQIMSLPV
ncbi:MAG TPA: flagellar hook-basal body complex protein FliE [Ramlibacter sp.]|nr:flagellar hook-basal body complex protein FliE [Ramlibacter sp.]